MYYVFEYVAAIGRNRSRKNRSAMKKIVASSISSAASNLNLRPKQELQSVYFRMQTLLILLGNNHDYVAGTGTSGIGSKILGFDEGITAVKSILASAAANDIKSLKNAVSAWPFYDQRHKAVLVQLLCAVTYTNTNGNGKYMHIYGRYYYILTLTLNFF